MRLPLRWRAVVAAAAVVTSLGVAWAGVPAAGAAVGGPAANSAPAMPRVTGYHYQSADGCGHSNCSDNAFISLHTTNDGASHVYINGTVAPEQSGGAVITWAGVGGGNGTAHLQVGANFRSSSGVNYYYRLTINSVGADQWCDTTGNAPISVPLKCYA